ncbi:ABC transporter ATP-binding protein, partial [Streptomyces sp. KR55]|uniref:ABC transporter ATP-binding protein n=1 Tax=Streptomyces sp. KR55 TaxID=3457425 RepID=UPI003FD4F9A4
MKPDHEPAWTPPDDSEEQPRQVRRILKLFRPYRGRLLVVGLLVGASSLVSVATPFLLKAILDTAIPQGRTGLLTLLALGMILSAVLSSVFGVLQTLISTTVGQRVMHDLRTAVYGRLQRMSLAFFTRTRTGEVQSRIANDIGGMQATVTSTATSLVSNFTSVVATIIAMLALDWRLTVVSLLLLPAFVWISRRVGDERRKITTRRQKQMAAMAATVTESLSVSGILLGRTMGRAESLTKSFAEESDRLVDLEVRSNMAGRWRMAVITIVMAAMPAVIYWTAGLALHLGGPEVSIGTIVAFVSLQQGLFRPAVSLLGTGVQIQTSLALFQRIFEYLDLPVDITERERPLRLDQVKGEVRFEGVEFRYDGKDGPVLDGIDLTVPAGGSLAIVGPTGAGKSTLGYL